MKSALIVVALVLVGLVSTVRPAQANIWDWMQEWSGPGPFTSALNGKIWFSTVCLEDFKLPAERDENKPCFFFDSSSFVAEPNSNFPAKVTAYFAAGGVSWRLRRTIAAGVGLGGMTATANNTAAKFTVTAPRIVIEPIALAFELFKGKGSLQPVGFWNGKTPLWHVFKFYSNGTFIVGRLSGDSLGVSGTSYDRKNEYVLSRGFIVDLGELLALRW